MKDSTEIEIRELAVLRLAALRAIHHSTDLFDKNRDDWLAEEFWLYVNKTREEVVELLKKFDPIIDDYQEKMFQDKIERESREYKESLKETSSEDE